jgi:CDP-6-deoxy-D-xylo-4-hexulose-3-dehydrase
MHNKNIQLVSDTIDRNDIDNLIEWLNKDPLPKLTKGELTIELEKKWANKLGSKYSIFVNSGSSSILLTLAALKHTNRLKNNKIVVPGLSWATDLSSPILLGLDPILCDCNLEDLSCDLDHLETLFKQESPSVLILVSVLGLIPNMDKILDLCKQYDVILLEDVCESMGSKFNDRYLGTFGLASFFSMYFGHHLSTIEGGFINTNDDDLYHAMLMMRSHGWGRDLPEQLQTNLRATYDCDEFSALYNFYLPGFNLRATDLQAFIGIRAIDKLDTYALKRNENFLVYLKNIKTNYLNIRVDDNNFISNFAFPVVNVHRNSIVTELKNNQIEVRPLIAGNLANKPVWYENFIKPKLRNCELLDQYGFYIPNHQDLNKNEIISITNILNKYGK